MSSTRRQRSNRVSSISSSTYTLEKPCMTHVRYKENMCKHSGREKHIYIYMENRDKAEMTLLSTTLAKPSWIEMRDGGRKTAIYCNICILFLSSSTNKMMIEFKSHFKQDSLLKCQKWGSTQVFAKPWNLFHKRQFQHKAWLTLNR